MLEHRLNSCGVLASLLHCICDLFRLAISCIGRQIDSLPLSHQGSPLVAPEICDLLHMKEVPKKNSISKISNVLVGNLTKYDQLFSFGLVLTYSRSKRNK